MSTAVSSAFKTGVALAGAGAIAMSPLVPTHDARVIPTVTLPSVELSGLATPALGAIPYQIGINTLGNLLALAPILIGSTEQCTACLGPGGNLPVPFTGWGLIGLGAGLITSPIAFVQTFRADGSVNKALGAALLAIQTPLTNTFALLRVPREMGGFALQAALDRAFNATKDIVDYTVNILAQALVTGPVTVAVGAVTGAQIFASTLATTGDLVTAFNAGRAPIEAAVNKSLTALTNEIDEGRSTVYADLITGPGAATSPIPTVSAPPPLMASAVAGPVTRTTTSFKAVPARAARAAAATGDDNGSGAADSGTGSSSSKPGKSTGGSKRHHSAD